jgi:hypothetical protein
MTGNEMFDNEMTDREMTDSEITSASAGRSRRRSRLGWGAGAVATVAVGGAMLAGALPASAATTTASPSATSSASSGSTGSGPTAPAPGTDHGTPPAGQPAGGPGGPGGGQRAGETLLTGTQLASAKAAALKAVPGGTVDRAETDADGAAFEAHMTKADGTKVTVKMDSSFTVTAVQAGMGTMKAPATSSSG